MTISPITFIWKFPQEISFSAYSVCNKSGDCRSLTLISYTCYRLYWTPAPPKMNLAPATIRSQLYPDYQGASMLQESLGAELRTVTGLDSEDNDETVADLDTEELRARNRCSVYKCLPSISHLFLRVLILRFSPLKTIREIKYPRKKVP